MAKNKRLNFRRKELIKGIKDSDNVIYRNFKLGLKYIKDSKKYIWFSFYLFIFFILIGYVFPVFFKEQILNYIKELVNQTQDLEAIQLIFFIINNNVWSAFSGLVFGIFLGIVPLSVIVINGYVLGFVANEVVLSEGILTLWRLFPHGIFEIPAIMISVGLGLKLGTFLFYARDKAKGFLGSLIFFICLIFSLALLSLIISLFARTSDPVALQSFYQGIMKNPLIVFLMIVIFLDFVFLSIFISTRVFSKKERELIMTSLKDNLKNSIRAFIFVIIPLLIIAGIIEGILILALG